MKRLSFLLLDANVVIYSFELGIWDPLVDKCDIHLTRTVVGEADFYVQNGDRHTIDLAPYETAKRITVHDVPVADIRQFSQRFDPSYLEKLDPGETESLTIATNQVDCLICSADQIVFKVLGVLDRSEQGISLEEILQKAGLTRPVHRQYTKSFRAEIAARGFSDSIQGRGVKPKK